MHAKQFHVGDYIIYGHRGICKVKDIGHPQLAAIDKTRVYYTLKPVYTTEIIYTPVDTSIFMRRAINREQALELILNMPAIEDGMGGCPNVTGKELPNYYKALIDTHDCEDLVRLILVIYTKMQKAVKDKKPVGQIDQNYMRDAEGMLYGELSIALGIAKDRVPAFVEKMIEDHGAKNAVCNEVLA